MTDKITPVGFAYACPSCDKPMIPDMHMDVMHCFKCVKSVDLWFDSTPPLVAVSEDIWNQLYTPLLVRNKLPKKSLMQHIKDLFKR